ncbi:hypothetical protein RJ639_042184 [Escallonia herrerae]|uniref:Clp R domain-containing protein n=1 Tax=Escallonia herrerae TaxID=1293975 RepID=A0AA89BBL7_9ASTE|nr:hypothetical protein RJ639_042184 [Escallonia herrerae]
MGIGSSRDKAAKVVLLADEEAKRLGHDTVGTEQLLSGLIAENTGIAAKVHTLIGEGSAGGGFDAANILEPALARGELQCIGATTQDEHRMRVEKDPALKRRFQPVKVLEPSVDETIEIFGGLYETYESHHKVHYTKEALIAAPQLSNRDIRFAFC